MRHDDDNAQSDCVVDFSLPASIRNLKSLDTFKKHLKTYYFKSHYYGL